MKRLASNLIVAFVAFFVTFLTTYSNNTWSTSLYRSFYGFFLFFLFMFPVKWVLRLFLERKQTTPLSNQVGSTIDIKTPEENLIQQFSDSTNQRDQDQMKEGFVPLAPPKLSKLNAASNMKPEDVANAVRALTSQR
jgi:flagellar biosynthesis/type III secretory pathway M-ring protein FliF/YscJ